MAEFPKRVFVYMDTDHQGALIALTADADIDLIDADHDGEAIGVYELVDVTTLRVTRTLEPDK